MTARYVADEAELREAFLEVRRKHRFHQGICTGCEWVATTTGRWADQHAAHHIDVLLASGVVQPREDAVREAQAEGAYRAMWQFFLRLPSPTPMSDAVQREAMRLKALAPTDPGMDRPAVAEDGQDPRYSGTGGA